MFFTKKSCIEKSSVCPEQFTCISWVMNLNKWLHLFTSENQEKFKFRESGKR